jgi:hypothetical protein
MSDGLYIADLRSRTRKYATGDDRTLYTRLGAELRTLVRKTPSVAPSLVQATFTGARQAYGFGRPIDPGASCAAGLGPPTALRGPRVAKRVSLARCSRAVLPGGPGACWRGVWRACFGVFAAL